MFCNAQAHHLLLYPKVEEGIQNIRKRGHRLRTSTPAPPPATAAVNRAEQQGLGKGRPVKGYRLTTAQRKKERDVQQLGRQKWDELYATATAEWGSRIIAGKVGRGHQSASEFAASLWRCRPVSSPSPVRCSSTQCATVGLARLPRRGGRRRSFLQI